MANKVTAYVSVLPKCDFHPDRDAHYDAKLPMMGPWASVCDDCFNQHGCGLGTGKGQAYRVGEPPTVSMADRRKQAREAILANDFDAFEDACGDGDPMEFLEF